MTNQNILKNPVIRKGDMVQIIAGREKGKTGKVVRVLRDSHRVVVEKLNLIKRHSKPTQKAPQGGIIEKEAPMSYSNVLLLCPKCNTGVRANRKVEGDKKVRVCKKCGGTI